MDSISTINILNVENSIRQAKENLSPDFLLIILGPTASGKTKLAVNLAQKFDGEIISADSRQIYRGLDIGTGKDLAEYGNTPYHLIDIKNPIEIYNINLFRNDFFTAFDDVISRRKMPILCGGTGSYIQSLLQVNPYISIPKSERFHEQYQNHTKPQLIKLIEERSIPEDFKPDLNSHKRLIRALEIVTHVSNSSAPLNAQRTIKNYFILGINPDANLRRKKIDDRLQLRIEQGLIDEVTSLRTQGVPDETLLRLGLEYKYCLLHLLGKMSRDEFERKLKTEIHRYAKRQMTYFRKMEKDGIKIHWIENMLS